MRACACAFKRAHRRRLRFQLTGTLLLARARRCAAGSGGGCTNLPWTTRSPPCARTTKPCSRTSPPRGAPASSSSTSCSRPGRSCACWLLTRQVLAALLAVPAGPGAGLVRHMQAFARRASSAAVRGVRLCAAVCRVVEHVADAPVVLPLVPGTSHLGTCTRVRSQRTQRATRPACTSPSPTSKCQHH